MSKRQSRLSPPELRQALSERKAELLALLSAENEAAAQFCPSCGERLTIRETATYKASECPTRPVHFSRVEGKPDLAGFFSEPAGGSKREAEVRQRALGLARRVVKWQESISPYVLGMREYLSMPHADGFGQREYQRLRELESELDRLSLAVAGGELSEKDFDRAFKEYQQHWRQIRRLFVETYHLDPGCGSCGFPHAENADCLAM